MRMSGSQRPAPAHGASAQSRSASKRRQGEIARLGVSIVLAVLITLFAVLNLESVEVDWIFGSSKVPLIVVVIISLLVGVALTLLVKRRSRKR